MYKIVKAASLEGLARILNAQKRKAPGMYDVKGFANIGSRKKTDYQALVETD